MKVQKYGFDGLRNGEWQFLYNLKRMTIHEAFNWMCNMNGIIKPEKQYDAIRLVRLGKEDDRSES